MKRGRTPGYWSGYVFYAPGVRLVMSMGLRCAMPGCPAVLEPDGTVTKMTFDGQVGSRGHQPVAQVDPNIDPTKIDPKPFLRGDMGTHTNPLARGGGWKVALALGTLGFLAWKAGKKRV